MDILPREAKINNALLIGGEPMNKQFFQLKKNPKIIIGTPGRIFDHTKRKSLDIKHFDTLVLDETDRMLDMGFSIKISEIVEQIESERQTLYIQQHYLKILSKLLKDMTDPVRVSVGKESTPAVNVKHEQIKVKANDKYDELLNQVTNRTGSIIVFVGTKINTEKVAKKLRLDKMDAEAVHGDLRHTKRQSIVQNFRAKKFRILVATDVAARGLDIPHIEHVINYDLPQCPEDYIHRIGRTARGGAKGEAITFISAADDKKWRAIDIMLNPDKQRSSSNDSVRKFSSHNDRRPSQGNRSNNGERSAKVTPFKGKSFKILMILVNQMNLANQMILTNQNQEVRELALVSQVNLRVVLIIQTSLQQDLTNQVNLQADLISQASLLLVDLKKAISLSRKL